MDEASRSPGQKLFASLLAGALETDLATQLKKLPDTPDAMWDSVAETLLHYMQLAATARRKKLPMPRLAIAVVDNERGQLHVFDTQPHPDDVRNTTQGQADEDEDEWDDDE